MKWPQLSLSLQKNLLSQRVFERLASSPLISIAAIQGPAVAGGFELALSCDLRVMSPDAWFSLPEVSLGLIPAAGGCSRLSKMLGVSRAKQVILAGDRIDAKTALDWGLANRLDPNPKAYAAAWLKEILKQDKLALELAKRAIETPLFRSRKRVCLSTLHSKKN